MKILYGIQGTGHGHISRAREILPLLSRKAEVDVLISGSKREKRLNRTDITYKRGLSFTYDSKGGISFLKTALKLDPITFLRDLSRLDINKYDLVISDFEPISSWAAIKAGKKCIGLSHQAAFLSEKTPRPEGRSVFAEHILARFAPFHRAIGFHFLRYDSFIEGPIIRKEVRNLSPGNGNHISVYLPVFDHQVLTSIFLQCRQIQWHLFSPLCSQPYTRQNVTVRPVVNEPFLESLESSAGVITSAGFETCSEAMYLGKKLMVIPIKNQYEQLCNVASLKKMGVPVVYDLNEHLVDLIDDWLINSTAISISEIANTEKITKKLLRYAGTGRKKSMKSWP
ncbi:glycosyltransferase family protein [soil metagenome]